MSHAKKTISYYKYTISLVIIYITGFSSGYYLIDKTVIKDKDLQLEVRFSPQDNCIKKITEEINNATEQILFQVCYFTSNEIAEALIQKHKQGIQVIIIADKGQENNILIKKMKKHNINIYIDKMPGIAHNKILIIDKKIVFTGSFNFTNAAQYRNAENSILIKSEKFAKFYIDNFWTHYKQSTPL